jgi:HEAT repeat protein
MMKVKALCFMLAAVLALSLTVPIDLRAATSQNFDADPHSLQVRQQIGKLKSPEENARAAAAEALGFLRAYQAADALAAALHDTSAKVRRQAAISIA